MEFSGVGLRAYDLALFVQMLLLKLFAEHWLMCPKHHLSREGLGNRADNMQQSHDDLQELKGCKDCESSQRKIGQTLMCMLNGYSKGIGDCPQLDVRNPTFIDQVCGLIACEMMWT